MSRKGICALSSLVAGVGVWGSRWGGGGSSLDVNLVGFGDTAAGSITSTLCWPVLEVFLWLATGFTIVEVKSGSSGCAMSGPAERWNSGWQQYKMSGPASIRVPVRLHDRVIRSQLAIDLSLSYA